jgi:predicted secreted protein
MKPVIIKFMMSMFSLSIFYAIIILSTLLSRRTETFKRKDKDLLVELGSEFELEVKSNWNTAYRWFMVEKPDEEIAMLKGLTYTEDNFTYMGIEKWKFVSRGVGTTDIVLHNSRISDKGSNPSETQRFTVTVI